MKTCELCGERIHDGPCYADLRADWKQQDQQKWILNPEYDKCPDIDPFWHYRDAFKEFNVG